MAERLNIWGNRGCKLPNGKLCYACCVRLHVPLDHNYFKPSYCPCPSLYNTDGGFGGCKCHKSDKPYSCSAFYCDNLTIEIKLELIAAAYSLNTVSLKEAIKAAKKISRRPDVEKFIVNFAEVFKQTTTAKDIDFTTIETI